MAAVMPAEPAPIVQPGVIAAAAGRSSAEQPVGPVVARRTLGESRRLGLGAPLVGPAPSAARATGRSDLPVARRARSADAALPVPELAPAPPAVLPAAAGPAPLPRLTVARRSAPPTIAAAADAMRPVGLPGGPASQPAPEAAKAPDATGAHGAHGEAGQVPSTVGGDPWTGAPAGPADVAGAAADAPGSTRPLVGASSIGISRLAIDEPVADAGTGPAADHDPGGPPRAWTSVAASNAGPAGTAGPGSTSGVAAGVAGPGAGGTASDSPGAAGTLSERGTSDLTGTAAAGATAATRSAPGPTAAALSPTTRTAPASLPLVAARAISSSPSASMASLGHRPADGPSPVVARLAGGPPDVRPPDGNRTTSTTVGRLGVAATRGAAVQREVLPVGARPASGGSDSVSGGISALPLAHAAPAPTDPWSTDPGAAAPDRSDRALSWTPDAGFTSVAALPRSVQRAVEIDEVTTSVDASAGAAAGSGGAGQAGPAAAPAAGASPDYDELAEHLYDRIRSRLTTELLLDRERSGTLVDA